MTDTSTIFWDVDTQVDFMLPHGKLYVPGAENIIPNLRKLTNLARDNALLIVASMCAHREGDAEFAQFPPHCLVGTPGQQKVPETVILGQTVVPNQPVELPDLRNTSQLIIEKQQFDVFTNPNTAALISRLAPKRVVLYGVVTEICVVCAARGLLDRGVQLDVVTDATRYLDEAKGRATLEEVAQRGGRLAQTEDVLRALAA